MNSYNVADFIKQNSFTGNTMLDSLIIANIIPLIMAYSNGLLNLLKTVGSSVFSFIWMYLVTLIKTCTVGKTICKIEIDQHNHIYDVLYEQIFTQGVKSDINGGIITKLLQYSESKSKISDYYNVLNLELDFTGTNIFKYIHKSYCGSTEHKIFRYKDFLVKFIFHKEDYSWNMKKEENKNNIIDENKSISIEVITCSTKYIGYKIDANPEKIIEDFLVDRFNIEDKIPYVYNIILKSCPLTICIKNFASKMFIDSSTGLIYYGDKVISNNKKDNNCKMSPQKLDIQYKHNNLNGDIDKDDLMISVNNFDVGYKQIYRKFLKCEPKSDNGYCYFVNNNVIYLLGLDSGETNINIISQGKLLTHDFIKKSITDLIQTAKKHKDSPSKKDSVNIYKYTEKKWRSYSLDKRSFDTLYLPQKQLAEIKSEIDNFIAMEKIHTQCQIPYRKGFLFYGPPGTGKTSLVKTIAYEYQMNIFMINVNDEEINDDTVVDMLNSISNSSNKILLFEDIDSAFADKEIVLNKTKITQTVENKEEKINRKYLTYSGLLNALDGALSSHSGVITIMTTNYIEKLGSALVRCGRIDRKFELGFCNDEQIIKMMETLTRSYLGFFKMDVIEEELPERIKKFASKIVCPKTKTSKISPSQLQVYVLRYLNNFEELFSCHDQLLKL